LILEERSEVQSLFRQLLIICRDDSQASAALELICCLWGNCITKRNLAVIALLTSFKAKEEANWCAAVLRLGCYRAIMFVERKREIGWQEAMSAFDEACDTFNLEKDSTKKDIYKRLRSIASNHGRRDQRESMKQSTIRQEVRNTLLQHSWVDILSGLSSPLDGVTEEDARSLLQFFVSFGPLQPQDIEPLIQKLFHQEEQFGPTDRKRQSRASNRLEGIRGRVILPAKKGKK
jgi:hypothetical protein